MDMKGIILWAGFFVIAAVIMIVSRRMKKQIEENGIETTGVVSRIEDHGGSDEITVYYYVKYTIDSGEEVEGILTNPRSDLAVGQRVQIKYHPKYTTNARLV